MLSVSMRRIPSFTTVRSCLIYQPCAFLILTLPSHDSIKCIPNLITVKSTIRSGGGHFHTWEYWGCAAGQDAFLSFQLWHRVSFLSFRNCDRVLFLASNSLHPLIMYFADFSCHYQANSITFFSLIASKCYKQILKSLKRP